MKLVIDREKWLRGEGGFESKLLRKRDGKLCCLGQFALACGLKPENILEICTPLQIEDVLPVPMQFLLEIDSAGSLMHINDVPKILDREEKLTKEFATHGIEVEFVDAIEVL